MSRGAYGREKGVRYEQVRQRLPDPYIPQKGFEEPSLCPSCGVVYLNKRWSKNKHSIQQAKSSPKTKSHKCPACRKIEDHYVMGVVLLTGSFASEHREEIENLIKNEEQRAIEKNPLERIMTMGRVDGGLRIETTADSLALRIGRVLCRAFKGKSEFKFRHGDKYVTVEWCREA